MCLVYEKVNVLYLCSGVKYAFLRFAWFYVDILSQFFQGCISHGCQDSRQEIHNDLQNNIIYTTLCSCATDLLYTQAVCDWLMCARDHASTNYLYEKSGNHGG